MTLADPKFFRPWRKSLGLRHDQAAKTLGMSEAEYRALENSERPIRRFIDRLVRTWIKPPAR